MVGLSRVLGVRYREGGYKGDGASVVGVACVVCCVLCVVCRGVKMVSKRDLRGKSCAPSGNRTPTSSLEGTNPNH